MLSFIALAVFQSNLQKPDPREIILNIDGGLLTLRAVARDVLLLDFKPNQVGDHPTDILARHGLRSAQSVGIATADGIKTAKFASVISGKSVTINCLSGNPTKPLFVDLDKLAVGTLSVHYSGLQNFYGMRGNHLFGTQDPRMSVASGILRNDGAEVRAGSQGDGGAPMAFTKDWGVFVDSVDGMFTNNSNTLEFSKGSRKETEAYLILGDAKRTIGVITDLTGHPPMPPKWTLGFMNSQWGTTQKEVTDIVQEYRQKQIPLDGFILDFDFKAWGEDNYGEFRWNSTSGKGSVSPNKFPDGASGEFGKEMLGDGVHLAGIMKPRILTQNADLEPTIGAKEATAHNWWMPGKTPYKDYFSGRLANDLNFADPTLRKWYWNHAEGLFKAGISGWWNDEADDGFDSLGFFHMQQSLYDGQRSASNQRVWSLNRNFYLGAQKFAFGTWSGDISTGFDNMADQRTRMLDLIDLGQSQWSMDSGGFNGHPTDENYARWIEFASMVPIMRVHNTYGEHRQPWVYGPIAEAASKKAIELRYKLFPYLYSAQRSANQTGIGIVRPLNWEFPEDPNLINTTNEWMVGDALLTSPIVREGQTEKPIYLPAGDWFDYATNKKYEGGQTINIQTDSSSWTDLPIFVRGGSIVATQPLEQFTGQKPVNQITLDVWPDKTRTAKFIVYDDDGETYNYEKGKFFEQQVSVTENSNGFKVQISKPKGSYKTSILKYLFRIHEATGVVEIEFPAGIAGSFEPKIL